MKWNSSTMNEEDREETGRMAQEMVAPYLTRVSEGSSAEIKEMVTKVIMALGLAMAVIGKTFLKETTSAAQFGGHVGDFVAETMARTQVTDRVIIGEKKEGRDESEQRSSKESLWG